ncbi:UBX domain-containing protein 6 [Intoshia linei]|uniref:UBX domain-containing protein 6 n=1 Tax=Intoshia linei TaxID=1819745 RepID=A0A177B9L3_9BILA|nr:UBX domain-containing protein 6 [Intoshia linei]
MKLKKILSDIVKKLDKSEKKKENSNEYNVITSDTEKMATAAELREKGPRANFREKNEQCENTQSSSRYVGMNNLVIKFTCPICGNLFEGKKNTIECIHKNLENQLENDSIGSSVLMIKSLNRLDLSQNCIATLLKYLNNILTNSDNPKFKQIRQNNKIILENVKSAIGGFHLLKSVGFVEKLITVNEKEEMYFVIYDFTTEICNNFKIAIETLENTNIRPMVPILHRDVTIYEKNQNIRLPVELDDEEFNMSSTEFKQIYDRIQKTNQDRNVLKTKAMREQTNEKLMHLYRYVLLRIILPEGRSIQAIFKSRETLKDVFELIKTKLVTDLLLFVLVIPPSSTYQSAKSININEDICCETLISLELQPSSVLRLHYDPSLFKDLAQSMPQLNVSILKL